MRFANRHSRPERDFVFLTGEGDFAHGDYLRGKVVLFVSRGDRIKGVQLRMTGRVRFRDHITSSCGSAQWENGDELLHQWDPFLIQNQPSPTDRTYEWPFELYIHGNQRETVRGCSQCSISYILEAKILTECGSETFGDSTPIRITRLPPLSAYELMDSFTAQGKWSVGVKYSVSVSHQAIALGGVIPVQIWLRQLDQGVEFTKARLYLQETHTLRANLPPNSITCIARRTVVEWPVALSNGQQFQTWEQHLQLPKVVRKCSPDFDICGVAISHTLHFAATLRDGSRTQLEFETSIPIFLFVSPDLPINGWGVFVQDTGTVGAEASNVLAKGICTPPTYDQAVNYGNPGGIFPPPYVE
ncbi:hypothetical protein GGI43DRAFT_427508 [Trichoderma evansii]